MRRKLQWLILSRLVIAGAVFATVAVTEYGSAQQSFTRILARFVGLIVILSAIYLVALRTPVSYGRQGCAQLLVDLGLVTLLVHYTGDVESPFPALYLVIIFAASALFNRRAVFLLASFGGLLYAVNGILKMGGLVGRAAGFQPYGSALSSSENLFALNLIAILAVAILSSHLAERVRRSEDELAIATKDLADYRIFNDRIIESMRSGLITTDLRGSIITFNR